MQTKIVWNGEMRLLRTLACGACLCDILPQQCYLRDIIIIIVILFQKFGFVAFLLFAQQPPAFKFFIFSGKQWKFFLGKHRFHPLPSWMRCFLLQLLCCRNICIYSHTYSFLLSEFFVNFLNRFTWHGIN